MWKESKFSISWKSTKKHSIVTKQYSYRNMLQEFKKKKERKKKKREEEEEENELH